MQVYDLAWSPNGEYIIAGSTDNCARIFTVNEGTSIEHFEFGVWLTLLQVNVFTKLQNTTITSKE